MSLRSQIQKLRLRKGDILVVRDHAQGLMDAMTKIHPEEIGINFYVPIIYAPDGIQKVSKEELQKVLNKLNEESQPVAAAVNHV